MSNLAVAQVYNDFKLAKVSDASKYQIFFDRNAVRAPAVTPEVSYACVVGDTAHPGPIPVRRTISDVTNENAWWNEPPLRDELPELEVDTDDDEVDIPPTPCNSVGSFGDCPPCVFGAQLGWVFPERIEEYPGHGLLSLHLELSSVEAMIATLERFPRDVRPDMADLYLSQVRLRDMVEFYTPPPPPSPGVQLDPVDSEDGETTEEWYERNMELERQRQTALVNRIPRSRRKRSNRAARKKLAADKERSDRLYMQRFTDDFVAESQSGFIRPYPDKIVAHNITLLAEKGINNSEITLFMRGRRFDRYVFSARSVRRMHREAIQMRSAHKKMLEAKERLDHSVEKKRRQRDINIAREEKFAESQGFGHLIGAAVKIAGAAAAVGSLLNINRVSNKARGLIDEIKYRIGQFAQQLSKLGDALKNAIMAGLMLFLFCKFKHPLIRAALVATIPVVYSGKIRKVIFDFFQREDDQILPETQSGGFAIIDSLPLLLSTVILGTIGMSSKHGLRAGMIAAVSALPRAVTGVEMLVDACVKGTQACLNVVLRWMNRPEVVFRRELDAKVDAAIKAAHAIDKQMNDPKFNIKESPSMYHTCMNSYAELCTLLALHNENVKVRQALAPYRAMMATHCGVLRDTLGRGAGFRQEPLSVCIESAPGVGKTMNMPCLIGTVLTGAGLWSNPDPAKLHQAYFCRPANSDYFDGYFGQECYFIDDLFSRKPNLNGMTQFDEVMAFYGTTTVMLNMAALEKKGLYPFTSSLLLMTTNLKCLTEIGADAYLLQPKAFERRIDIHVHIEPLPEYQIKEGKYKGQLNFELYAAEAKKLADEGKVGPDSHPWYIWECWDTHFGNTSTTFQPYTGRNFREVVGEIIDGLKRKSQNHVDNMEHLGRVLQVPPVVVPSVGEIETMAASQSGGDLCLKDTLSSGRNPVVEPIDATVDLPLPTYSYSKFKEEVKKYDLKIANSDEIVITGKQDTNKNCSKRLAGVLDEVKTPIGKKEWYDCVRKEGLIRDMVEGFLAGVATYLVVAVVLKPLLNALMGLMKGSEDVLRGESQSNERKEKRILKVPGSQVVAQQQSPDFSLWRTIYDQSYKLVVDVRDGTAVSTLGQVTFVKQNLAVFPNHFLTQLDKYEEDGDIDDECIMTFYACGDMNKVNMTVRAFRSFPRMAVPDMDLCFIHFKKCFRMHKDIVTKIIPEKDLAMIGGREVRLDTSTVCSSAGTLLPNAIRVTYNSDRVKLHYETLRTHSGLSYNRYLSYSANTIAGDCGAPLCLVDYSRFANRCFVGLHVAGQPDTGIGFATPITKEVCERAVAHFKMYEVNFVELSAEESLWPEDVVTSAIDKVPFTQSGLLGNTRPVCTTNKHVSIPIRSSTVKTGMGKAKVFTDVIREMNDGREPPVLVPMRMGKYLDRDTGEMVYPMQEALSPYIDRVFVAEDGSFATGLSAGLKAFADASLNYDSPVLSTEEAILGVPALGLKSITRSTSVGFPLCTFAKNKKYFFGSDDDMQVDTPEARALIADIGALDVKLRDGKRPFFVCRDFLKDEVRKVGKNARLIAGTDLSYYILCRKYFGSYVGAVTRTHKKSGICLGTNPYSDWGGIRRMLEKPDPTGRNVWDGDFAGFDSSQMPQLLWDCLDYINNWYMTKAKGADEVARVTADNKVRSILFLDLVYSKHITSIDGPANTILEWVKSLPSGHFLTSTINSMLSLGFVAAGYVALTGETNFWETSAAAVLGDDNVVSTSDEYVDRFNQVTLAKYLGKTFGMVYTAGRKGEDLKPVIGIDDVVFLQRRFAIKNGLDVCPIRPESFLHSLYYVKTNDPKAARETLLAGIELAFEELSMHDEKYWPTVSALLVEEKRKLNEAPEANILDSSAYFWRVRNRVPSYV